MPSKENSNKVRGLLGRVVLDIDGCRRNGKIDLCQHLPGKDGAVNVPQDERRAPKQRRRQKSGKVSGKDRGELNQSRRGDAN